MTRHLSDFKEQLKEDSEIAKYWGLGEGCIQSGAMQGSQYPATKAK